MRHDAAASWAFLEPVFDYVKEYVACLEAIHFQSVGPNTQYKNKTNFFLFNYYCNKFNLRQAFWNFTGAGHGKSIADAIGGTVKSLCDWKVMLEKDIVSANNINDIINQTNCKVKSFLVSQSNIENVDMLVPPDLKAIKET